jgi:catechol 2,3-dioxygenase-like lactoylglutathione lyase family enzyme
MHIDHVNISAPPDLLRDIRDFYCDVLGLTVGARPSLSRPGYWLYSDGKPIIHLIESLDHLPGEQQGCFDHFALQASSLAEVIEKLEATGTRFTLKHLPDAGMSQVFCRDPAGIRVEINFRDETL